MPATGPSLSIDSVLAQAIQKLTARCQSLDGGQTRALTEKKELASRLSVEQAANQRLHAELARRQNLEAEQARTTAERQLASKLSTEQASRQRLTTELADSQAKYRRSAAAEDALRLLHGECEKKLAQVEQEHGTKLKTAEEGHQRALQLVERERDDMATAERRSAAQLVQKSEELSRMAKEHDSSTVIP